MKTPSFNDPPLPSNDPDLRLSQHVGQELEDSRLRLIDPEVVGDPLLHLLETEQEHLVLKHISAASKRMAVWDKLEPRLSTTTHDTTNQPKRTPSRRPATNHLKILTPSFKYAFAAVIIVLIGVVAVANLQRSETPDLPVLATALQSPTVYQAADGSVITLRPNSTLYDATDTSSETTAENAVAPSFVLVGEGFFDIAHDPSRTVTVEAGEGLVQVLGTRFNLSTWGGRTALFLESGRVAFSKSDAQASVTVDPGQAVVLGADGELSEPVPTSGEQATDWMQDELAFESTKVALVIKELEHHFNLELSVPDSIASEVVTGRLLLNDQSRTLAELGTLLGGTFVETAPNVYRFE